jgi:hypothetical protein
MAYEYNLPVLASPNIFTITYATDGGMYVTTSGTLSLSAAQTLTTGFSSAGGLVNSRLGFTFGGTTLSALSASTAGISLSVLNNTGNIVTYGYLISSTWNPVTSGYAAKIGFSNQNYYTTVLTISSKGTSAKFLSGGNNTSVIDNILVYTPNSLNNVTVSGNLSSINSNQFRTVSRQARLVQGEY